MKQIFTLIALTLVTLAAQSRPVNIVTVTNDDWFKASSWSLGRIPQNGDSVVVPSGKTIVLTQYATYNNLYIYVQGVLLIKKSLTLDAASTIMVTSSGQVSLWASDRKHEIITIGGVEKLNETSADTQSGASFASSNTSLAPNGFTPLSSLPVTFSSFYAVKNSTGVQLTWATEQEYNNNNFEVQRSTDGSSWKVIAVVMGMGTSTTATQYSFTDKATVAGTVYYRLRQVDFDNNYQYSAIRSVRASEAAPTTKVYASNNNINIEFNTAVAGDITVRLFNAGGQLLAQQNAGQSTYRITLGTKGSGTGLYIVQVTNNKGWTESTKVVL